MNDSETLSAVARYHALQNDALEIVDQPLYHIREQEYGRIPRVGEMLFFDGSDAADIDDRQKTNMRAPWYIPAPSRFLMDRIRLLPLSADAKNAACTGHLSLMIGSRQYFEYAPLIDLCGAGREFSKKIMLVPNLNFGVALTMPLIGRIRFAVYLEGVLMRMRV